jgi:hypothetical protein
VVVPPLVGVRRTAVVVFCHQQQKPGYKKLAVEINVIQNNQICRSQFVVRKTSGADL